MELYWSSYRDYDNDGVYTDPTLWNNTGGYKDVSPCKDAQESLRFANIIFETFKGFPNMGPPRSINERNDYLPAHAKAPCILYEGGYLSTPSEALFMNSNAYRDEAAKRLADSADRFFSTETTITETKTTPSEINTVVGVKTKLNTVNIPENSENYGFTYVSNNPNIATVDGNGVVTAVGEGRTEIIVKPSTNTSIHGRVPVNIYSAPDINLEYEVYTKDGWQKVNNGGLAGSTDINTPIYGVRVRLTDEKGDIINQNILNLGYRTHVANVGWTNYTSTNQISGAESTENPIEAVQFSISGENADQYKLFYRSFVKDHDWTSFVTDNQNCGSEGLGIPVSGIEVMVLPSNISAGPVTTGTGFYSKYGDGNFRYATHISNLGWGNYTSDGQESGTPSSGENVEAIDFKASNNLPSGSVISETHISNIGWVPSKSETIGTTGQGLPIEAVKLSLNGDLGTLYNINYQVYVKGQGWTQPVSNGEEAGTTGQSLPIESIKIWLTEK